MYINGLGHYHPERRVSNEELMLHMDTSDEWIREHTGITERRYAADGQLTSDMCVRALTDALEDARADPDAIDVLMCATATPDFMAPSTAAYIANKLELRACTFDVNAACAGFIYGLALAPGLIHHQGYERVALCASDNYTRWVDLTDRKNTIFWGDAAGAAILQPERPEIGIEVVDVVLSSYNRGADLVRLPVGGTPEVNGPATKKIAFAGMVEAANEVLHRNDVAAADLRGFVCHQANLRVIEMLVEEIGVEDHQHWHNVQRFGNQGAASCVTALCHGLERNAFELADGDLFLLTVYGAGFVGGATLLRWVGETAPIV